MKYYPICIPTLCRFEHFKRCVESLKKCTHANETELVVGIDKPTKPSHEAGYNQICEYVNSLTGFKSIKVFKHEENLGAIGNWKYIQTYALDKYGAAILSEDDNEFAPCFLDFMNKSLEYYWDNPSVMTISGYSPIGFEKENYPLCFTKSICAWGIGRWKHKSYLNDRVEGYYRPFLSNLSKSLSLFFNLPSILGMLVVMVERKEYYGDVGKSVQNNEYDWYQLRPTQSLVINWGQDGSGLHSGVNKKLIQLQEERTLPYENSFDVDFSTVKVKSTSFVKRYQFWRYGDMGQFHILPQMKVTYLYLRYRLKILFKKFAPVTPPTESPFN